jgi:hypothetical protein
MELEGLTPIQTFPVVDRPMSIGEGIEIMAHRLGLSGGRIRELARDRYPSRNPVEEGRSISKFKIKCFLRSDIIFTDILHTGYEELKHIGLGRRYLINKILRAVVAGTCDSVDPTGLSGDFPPRSWLGEEKARYVKSVQEKCLKAVKHDDAKLLKSIKVRLRGISTQILISLAERCDAIRTISRRFIQDGLGSGLRGFSNMLVSYRKRFIYQTRTFDCKNRKKRSKRKYKGRSKSHKGFSVFVRSVCDLRKLLDPSIPNWYRRPTDEDRNESGKSEDINTRKPFHYKRISTFRKYGFSSIPGITEPVKAEEWNALRVDWTMSEARERFSLRA